MRVRSVIKYNKEKLRDKIYACWLGKNIGGTIGAPYEGTTEFLNVTGFNSAPGTPLPNDDLDLQLMWLTAMEFEGPWYFNSRTLGEYWLMGIDPNWSEYGEAKANLRDGVPAPLSGELYNKKWRNSNGAWIRSELWACLAPGLPSIACEYAFQDASVDHGMGEGTYAELFTATLESSAFFISDPRAVILKGLKSVPETSRVYKAVKLVLDEFDKGTDYKTVRDMLVAQSEDIGWFQAPANLGFVAIGLLYGGGDFKKSVLYAVNCGDDTDCTGATVGSIMGIMHGTEGIPEDWAEYVGDKIDFICINTMYRYAIPKTCTELTDRVMRLLPVVLYAHHLMLEWSDADEIPELFKPFDPLAVERRERYNFELPHTPYLFGYGAYDREPIISAGEEIKLILNVTSGTDNRAYAGENVHDTVNYSVKLILPDGWNAVYGKTLHVRNYSPGEDTTCWAATVTAGETAAVNHIYAVLESPARNNSLIVDFVIKG